MNTYNVTCRTQFKALGTQALQLKDLSSEQKWFFITRTRESMKLQDAVCVLLRLQSCDHSLLPLMESNSHTQPVTWVQSLSAEVQQCVDMLNRDMDIKSLHHLRMELSYKPVEYVKRLSDNAVDRAIAMHRSVTN